MNIYHIYKLNILQVSLSSLQHGPLLTYCPLLFLAGGGEVLFFFFLITIKSN